jgi:hypothetical protein
MRSCCELLPMLLVLLLLYCGRGTTLGVGTPWMRLTSLHSHVTAGVIFHGDHVHTFQAVAAAVSLILAGAAAGAEVFVAE